jgi:hypothetical protein
LTSTNSVSLVSPSDDTSFKPPNTSWSSTIGSFLSARAHKFQVTPSNTPTTARPGEASSTFPYVATFPTIYERFGEAEGSSLFDVAATPATSLSGAAAPASIDALNSSGAWTKTVPSSFKGNGVVVAAHWPRNGSGELR